MEAKDILEKVKLFFNELVAPAVPAAAAAPPAADAAKEYELKIGGKVTIDKLEVGGVVMIDGAPAVAGDIELADGTMITVGDNGVISEIKPGMPAEPPAPDMGAQFSEFKTSAETKFAAYENKFAAYEQRFADYEVKMSKATKVIEQLLQLSQLIVEAPAAAADPGVKSPAAFTEKPELQKFIDARKQLKQSNN